jgi:hypothetical protein
MALLQKLGYSSKDCQKIERIYKDTDYIVEQSCTVLNKVYDFYVGVEPMSAFIGNALIAAKPHHPILQYTLQMILRNHGDKAPNISSKSSFKTILEPASVFFPSLSIKPWDRMKT